MKKEKPEYGWYVKNLIISFMIIGIIGIGLIILGFLIYGWISILLLISGITIAILFLWPGLGMSIMNIILGKAYFTGIEMKSLNSIESPKILDVGCGTGRTAIKIAKSLKGGGMLHGIDIYSKTAIGGNALETVVRNAKLEGVEEKTSFQYGSAIEIPFESSMFDIVNFSSVLHELHMDQGFEKALKEAYRVLKPGGYLYVGEWNRTSWQLIVYSGIFCLVFKNYKHWLTLVEKYGFKIQEQKNEGGFYMLSAMKPDN
ncbi:MAG: class I SAM-dependent methyltransferase [Promethearchaeota archaeon]